mgnify:CR=1 FL=1
MASRMRSPMVRCFLEPDAFSPASCGPVNTVEGPTNQLDAPRQA